MQCTGLQHEQLGIHKSASALRATMSTQVTRRVLVEFAMRWTDDLQFFLGIHINRCTITVSIAVHGPCPLNEPFGATPVVSGTFRASCRVKVPVWSLQKDTVCTANNAHRNL